MNHENDLRALDRMRDELGNARREKDEVRTIRCEDLAALVRLATPRPAVATPAEVTDEMCSAAIMEFNKPSKGLQQDSMLSKARRCLRAALTAQSQARKVDPSASPAEVTDRQIACIAACLAHGRYVSEGMAGNEQFLKTLRNAVAEAVLASPSAGAVVPDGWEDPTGFSVTMVKDEANNWTKRSTGKQMLLNYAAALESGKLAAAPEVK